MSKKLINIFSSCSNLLSSFFILTFFIVNLYSQTTINILNNGYLDTKPLKEKLNSIKLKEVDSLQEIISKTLTEYFSETGYLRAKINSIDINKIDSLSTIINIDINEGKQFIIDEITIKIKDEEKIYRKDFIKNFDNRIANDYSINQIAEKILKNLETEGYIFAEVISDSLAIISEDEKNIFVNLFFSLNKNIQSKINEVIVEGNDITDESVILRQGRINYGDIFNDDYAEKILFRLRRINIFSQVDKPEFYFTNDNRGILKIKVKEGNTNSFDGIIGYLPAIEPNKDGYFTGLINVSFRNLFGTFRAFSIFWQKIDRTSQEFEIKYFEPYLFGLPVNLTPKFQQRQQDSSYIDRIFSISSDINLFEFFTITLNFSNQRIIPSSDESINKPSNSNSIITGIALTYDTRNDLFLASEGLFFKTDYALKNKKIYDNTEANYNLIKIILDFEFYHKFFDNYVFFISFHGKQISGDNIELGDIFRLGGLNTLRGYNENQFFGSRIAYSNIELRAALGGRNVIYPFIDFGYYYSNLKNQNLSGYKFGYGIGMIFETPIGFLRVNYGLNKDLSITDGKIHFGIINAF